MPKNSWKQHSDDLWQCFKWDVCLRDGKWRPSRYHEWSDYDAPEFETAEEAMEWADKEERSS